MIILNVNITIHLFLNLLKFIWRFICEFYFLIRWMSLVIDQNSFEISKPNPWEVFCYRQDSITSAVMGTRLPPELKSIASSSRWSWSWSSYWCSSWCWARPQPRSSCSLGMRRVPQVTNLHHAHLGPIYPKTLAKWYVPTPLDRGNLTVLNFFLIHVNHIRLQMENVCDIRKTSCVSITLLSVTITCNPRSRFLTILYILFGADPSRSRFTPRIELYAACGRPLFWQPACGARVAHLQGSALLLLFMKEKKLVFIEVNIKKIYSHIFWNCTAFIF